MKKIAVFLAVPLVTACSSLEQASDMVGSVADVLDISPYLHPYRIDVRQGNMVTQEMAAQLKPGLTKDQVRFILGTPLLTDVFHADRWDYVYRLQPGDGEVQQRRLVVFFTDGKLTRVGGDVVGEAAAAGAVPKPAARVIEIKAPVNPEEKKEVPKDAAPEAAASQQP